MESIEKDSKKNSSAQACHQEINERASRVVDVDRSEIETGMDSSMPAEDGSLNTDRKNKKKKNRKKKRDRKKAKKRAALKRKRGDGCADMDMDKAPNSKGESSTCDGPRQPKKKRKKKKGQELSNKLPDNKGEKPTYDRPHQPKKKKKKGQGANQNLPDSKGKSPNCNGPRQPKKKGQKGQGANQNSPSMKGKSPKCNGPHQPKKKGKKGQGANNNSPKTKGSNLNQIQKKMRKESPGENMKTKRKVQDKTLDLKARTTRIINSEDSNNVSELQAKIEPKDKSVNTNTNTRNGIQAQNDSLLSSYSASDDWWWDQEPKTRKEIGVGTLIKKHFKTADIFNGMDVPYDGFVRSIWKGSSQGGKKKQKQQTLYKIQFKDGDEEDLAYEQLLPCANLCTELSSSNYSQDILPVNETISYYFASDGENIYRAAKQLGCKVDDILQFNKEWYQFQFQLSAKTKLKKGTILRIDPSLCSSEKIEPLLLKEKDWLNKKGGGYLWRSIADFPSLVIDSSDDNHDYDEEFIHNTESSEDDDDLHLRSSEASLYTKEEPQRRSQRHSKLIAKRKIQDSEKNGSKLDGIISKTSKIEYTRNAGRKKMPTWEGEIRRPSTSSTREKTDESMAGGKNKSPSTAREKTDESMAGSKNESTSTASTARMEKDTCQMVVKKQLSIPQRIAILEQRLFGKSNDELPGIRRLETLMVTVDMLEQGEPLNDSVIGCLEKLEKEWNAKN